MLLRSDDGDDDGKFQAYWILREKLSYSGNNTGTLEEKNNLLYVKNKTTREVINFFVNQCPL